jgi:hypothetical protein
MRCDRIPGSAVVNSHQVVAASLWIRDEITARKSNSKTHAQITQTTIAVKAGDEASVKFFDNLLEP